MVMSQSERSRRYRERLLAAARRDDPASQAVTQQPVTARPVTSPATGPDLAAVQAAIANAAVRRKGEHTPAFEWLWRHRHELAVSFATAGVKPWAVIADELNRGGIKCSASSLWASWRTIERGARDNGR
jgi:hypothetical protein